MTHILAVDDSISMRMLLTSALTARGFAVDQAEDGVAALAWLEARAPDLLITDINMPRMDGFDLIGAVREQPRFRDLPILVLSTESSDEKRALARRRGASGWIVKPFDGDSLAAAIRRVIH